MKIKEAAELLQMSEMTLRLVIQRGSSLGEFYPNNKRGTYVINASKVYEFAGKAQK